MNLHNDFNDNELIIKKLKDIKQYQLSILDIQKNIKTIIDNLYMHGINVTKEYNYNQFITRDEIFKNYTLGLRSYTCVIVKQYDNGYILVMTNQNTPIKSGIRYMFTEKNKLKEIL